MTEFPETDRYEDLPGGAAVGVMDAVRMGWRLMMADFWPIWVVGLVAYAILAAIGVVGGVIGIVPILGPIVNGCIQLAAGIFLQPPIMAGLFYAVRNSIDGSPAQVGEVFEGFRQRYWQSVVAMLLPNIIGLVAGVLIGGILLTAVIIGQEAGSDEDVAIAVGIALAIAIPLAIILCLVMLLFLFSLLAVWDHPESGWQAMKDSVRLVKAHYWSCIGLALLFVVLSVAAVLAGLIACCVGVFFTMPVLMVWWSATLIYLYRSWTGQPLVQAVAEEPPAYDAGPMQPTDIEPPPPAPPIP
ncbi:MAG TPA: hypothetical protein VM238_14825 [Phycisphaerae bacterium]|nr:hypothetical protein [Phycisphaerae bacterium]